MYQCSVCKKEYTNPVDMAKCILKCDEKQEKEAAEKRHQELLRQESERIVEIQEAATCFYELIKKYEKDYQKPVWFNIKANSPLCSLFSALPFESFRI